MLGGASARKLEIAKFRSHNAVMKRVRIGEFRDRASELIRRAAGGETIVILNRNREVAKIVPISATTARTGGLVGCLAGTAEVKGDIEAPIAPAETWF
jgi:prevent-host-death family protein